MSKYPLLDSLRADRERMEAEVTAPVREQLDLCRAREQATAAALRAVEQALGTKIGAVVVEQITRGLRDALQREIHKAVSPHRGTEKPFTITLSMEDVRWADPRSLERQVLDRYLQQSLPALSVRALAEDSTVNITTLDVRVPSLGYRTAVMH